MPAASAVSPRATRSSKRALVPENPPASTAADKHGGGATTQTRGRSGIQPSSSGNQRRPLATKTNTTSRNAAQANEVIQEPGAPVNSKQQGSATAAGEQQPAQRLPVARGAGAAAAAAFLATTPRRSSRSMSEPESVDSELERALLLESQQPPTRMSSLTKSVSAPQAQAVKSNQAARQHQNEGSAEAGPSRLPLSPLTPSQRKNAPARPPSRQRSIDSLAEFDAEWVEESRDISKRTAILAAVTAPQQQQQQKRPATPTSAARRGAGAPGSQQRVPRASTPVPGRSYLDDQMIYGAGDNDDDLPSLLGAAAAARRTPSMSSSTAAARGRRQQQQRASGQGSARKRRPDSPSPSTASKNRKCLMLPPLGSDALDQEMAKTKEARTAAFVRSASEALARSSQSRSLHGSARKPVTVQESARKAVERSGGGSKRRRKEVQREEDEEGEVDEADPFGFFKAEERIKRRRVMSVGSATKGRQEQEDANEEGGGNGGEDGADLVMGEDGGFADGQQQGEKQVPKTPQRPQGQDEDEELPDVRGILAQSKAAQPAAEGESEDDDAILRRILGSADASSDPPRAPEKHGDNVTDKAADKGQAGGQANETSSDTDDYIAPGLGRGKKRAASKTPSKSKKSASISPVATRKKGNPKTPASAKRQQPRRGSRRPAGRNKEGQGSDAVDSSDSDNNHGSNNNKWKVDSLMEQVLPRRYAAPKNRKKQQEQKEQKQQKRARFEDDEDDENDQGEDSLLGPVWSSDDSSSPPAKGRGNAKGKKGKGKGKAPAGAVRGGKGSSKKVTPATKRKATSTSSSSTKAGAKGRSPRNVTAAATRATRGKKATVAKTTSAAGSGTGLAPSSSPTPHMTYDPDDDDDDSENDGHAGSTTRRSTSGKSLSSNYGRGPPTAEQLEDRRRRGDDALEEYEFEEELVLDR